MSHADIIDHMMDRQLWEYQREQEELAFLEEEALYECQTSADEQLQPHYDAICAVIHKLSHYYGVDVRTIMDEMVMPSLDATL